MSKKTKKILTLILNFGKIAKVAQLKLTKEKKFENEREDIYEKMEKVFKRVFCAAIFYVQPVGRTNLGSRKSVS